MTVVGGELRLAREFAGAFVIVKRRRAAALHIERGWFEFANADWSRRGSMAVSKTAATTAKADLLNCDYGVGGGLRSVNWR